MLESFKSLVNEAVGSKKYEELNKRIKTMTKDNYDKLILDIDKAFKDREITGQEFDELDSECFRKMKYVLNKE